MRSSQRSPSNSMHSVHEDTCSLQRVDEEEKRVLEKQETRSHHVQDRAIDVPQFGKCDSHCFAIFHSAFLANQMTTCRSKKVC